MNKSGLITLCTAMPFAIGLLIWLVAGFIRWDFDLSTVSSFDRGIMMFIWIAALALTYCIFGVTGIFDEVDE